MNIQLYDSNGNKFEDEVHFYGSTKAVNNISFKSGQVYYIKVWPYNYSDSGTYHITFGLSSTPPALLPSNATQLTENIWADGNISEINGEWWFKFTATANTQYYIHANFGTTNSLNVQLYDSNTNTVIDQTRLYSSTKYVSGTLTANKLYYIKVLPYYYNTGTYQITFNTSNTAPTITLPSNAANAIQLTANKWTNGNFIASDSEQWFKFTATADTHYIHTSFDSSLFSGLRLQLFTSNGNTIGSNTTIGYYSANKYTSWTSLTAGQEYYIMMSPTSSGGPYKIALNTSTSLPPVELPLDATTLTANILADGDFTTSPDNEECQNLRVYNIVY
ncbi:hypothetical protein, partial [Treponema sp. R6D11]